MTAFEWEHGAVKRPQLGRLSPGVFSSRHRGSAIRRVAPIDGAGKGKGGGEQEGRFLARDYPAEHAQQQPGQCKEIM
jgi:hypothetical protein